MGVLEDYADKVAGKAKPEWRRPELSDFQMGHKVLSFDQSLTKTGWVYLEVAYDEEGRLVVRLIVKGTIRTKTDVESHEGSFEKADQLRQAMNDLHEELDVPVEAFPDAILVERPSVRGKRIESSLLAGYVIRGYCWQWFMKAKLASIQHSRTVLAGIEARDDKKAGHEALKLFIPESGTRKWNEDMRDAAINALAHLHDLKAAA